MLVRRGTSLFSPKSQLLFLGLCHIFQFISVLKAFFPNYPKKFSVS